jgi:hypothetical protein
MTRPAPVRAEHQQIRIEFVGRDADPLRNVLADWRHVDNPRHASHVLVLYSHQSIGHQPPAFLNEGIAQVRRVVAERVVLRQRIVDDVERLQPCVAIVCELPGGVERMFSVSLPSIAIRMRLYISASKNSFGRRALSGDGIGGAQSAVACTLPSTMSLPNCIARLIAAS